MEQKQNKKGRKKGVKPFIGGTILTDERVTRQIPFILLLVAWGIVFITNRNWSEKTIRNIEIIQDELEELRAESITFSAKLMNASRPSEVAKKVNEAGLELKEPARPPQRILVKKEKK
ncbi:MAG: hypothetical protein CR996_02215 [Draconibacterium sp.]|nr:MAG: hypothetical protein CR996_02215 [Draconibacterium sp.]